MRLALFIVLVFLPRLSFAQTNAAPQPVVAPEAPKPAPASGNTKPAASAKPAHTSAQMQTAIEQLTQSNHDLLDLLKQQQAVLEDIQFDRRQQSRHIQSLEERLESTLLENARLQAKVNELEADAAVRPSLPGFSPASPAPPSAAIKGAPAPATTNNAAASMPNPTETITATPAPPPPPQSYLPPAPAEVALGGPKSWHRIMVLKGNDTRQTDLFHIEGRHWRVLWHNQDPDDPKLKGTSGLFINAFPKDDTIPQKVCAKVGSGGDMADLTGPGNYYLKIEASGGSWELAVEDFH